MPGSYHTEWFKIAKKYVNKKANVGAVAKWFGHRTTEILSMLQQMKDIFVDLFLLCSVLVDS
jgi:hypothetical protein